MQNLNDLRLAVLIDADNIPYKKVKEMMEEVALYGIPTFKRIYGDWTQPNLIGWKKVLLENAITPIQQYSYTVGKNSSDSALIIDAMDILYSGKVDGFCIVSSDSDFTRLAIRLREAGMKVIGIGEKKTPNPFIIACDKFIYLEVLQNQGENTEVEEKENNKIEPKQKRKNIKIRMPENIVVSIKNTIDTVADDDGWAFLGDVGNLILKKKPDFDPRNYGYQKLSTLIKSIKTISVDQRESGSKYVKHIFVKNLDK
ncbi:MAG: NYN domain-containing protein [Dethiosulfatibacter sp.]|nr:NYN domain-containing protein [Dethiosulfatibacter sp.]